MMTLYQGLISLWLVACDLSWPCLRAAGAAGPTFPPRAGQPPPPARQLMQGQTRAERAVELTIAPILPSWVTTKNILSPKT